jgi:DDE_Tnp_1-associated
MNFLEHIRDNIPDSRKARGKRYPAEYIFLFSVLAILCGALGYSGIAHWISVHRIALNKIYGLNWFSSPSGSSIQRILVDVITEEQIEAILRLQAKTMIKNKLGKVPTRRLSVAIDGKTLRGSFDNRAGTEAMSLISVISTDLNLVLATSNIQNKGSETTGVQNLLADLKNAGIDNLHISMDALHTQKKL